MRNKLGIIGYVCLMVFLFACEGQDRNYDPMTLDIDKEIEFIEKNPEIQSFFLKRMSTGLEGYVVRSQFLIRGSAEQKVVSSLLLLGLRFGRKVKNYTHIDLPLTHQDVADLSGITRETATLCINELEDNKLIAKKGKYFKLFNEKKLNEICKTFEDGSHLDFNF